MSGCRMMADGRALMGGAALDGAMGAGPALLMEEEFQRLLKECAPLAAWEEFIRDALTPSGPLHPTHHLVLRAKRQVLCPDKDGAEGEIINCKLRIALTLGEKRRQTN